MVQAVVFDAYGTRLDLHAAMARPPERKHLPALPDALAGASD